MKNKNIEQGWEKGFDEKFPFVEAPVMQKLRQGKLEYTASTGNYRDLVPEIKAFISQTIAQEKQRQRVALVEQIERMKNPDADTEALGWEILRDNSCCPGDDAWAGYEKAIEDVLSKLRT